MKKKALRPLMWIKLYWLIRLSKRYYKIATQDLMIAFWDTSKYSAVSLVLGKVVPMWSPKGVDIFSNFRVLFIHFNRTCKMNNKDIGLDLNRAQPYYFTKTPEILYGSKQRDYNFQYNAKYKIPISY